MSRNKIVEWYCPNCKAIKTPRQRLIPKAEGMVVEEVLPRKCPDCNTCLQRHVTKVKR